MQTRLSLFCEKLMEAGWLVALTSVPLFTNFYGTRPFDLPKVILLRSLAWMVTLTFSVWVLERKAWVEGMTVRWAATTLRKPLVLPALLLLLVHLLSTVTSVLPSIGLWGGYGRQQGTYTLLGYLVFFCLIYRFVRRRDQLERLIDTLLVAGWAVALYFWLQYLGFDPATWRWADRLFSTLGNPIFLSAYLIMLVPLAVARFLRTLRTQPLLAGVYGILLVMQLSVIVFTESRGPFLGLLAGLFSFFVFLASRHRRARLLGAVVVLAVVAVSFLVALNLPDTPLEPLKSIGLLKRMGQVVSDQPNRTVTSRILTWESASRMVGENPLRFLVGYGPDTFRLIYYRHASRELIELRDAFRNPDRAHNEVWDVWVSAGLLGVAALFLLYGAVFYHGLAWLGLISSRRQRAVFWLILVAGGLGSAAVAGSLGSIAFLGIGLSFGSLAGLLSYPIVRILAWREMPTPREKADDLIVIAVLAAVVAHLVEVQVGFSIESTQSLFWGLLAVMAAAGSGVEEPLVEMATRLGRGRSRGRKRVSRASVEARPTGRHPAVLYGCLAALILLTLIFDLVTLDFDFGQDGPPLLVLLAGIWLLPATLVLGHMHSQGKAGAAGWTAAMARYGISSLGVLAGLLLAHTILTRGLGVSGEQHRAVLYFLYLLAGMVSIAVVLLRRAGAGSRWWTRRAWLVLPVAVVAGWGIWSTNLSLSEGDFYLKLGQSVDQQSQAEIVYRLYRRAVDVAPKQAGYHRAAGEAALLMMATATQEAEATRWFEASRTAFLKAQELNPLDPDHDINLGRLYLAWSSWARSRLEEVARIEQAWMYFRRAIEQSPEVHRAQFQADILRTLVLLGDTSRDLGNLARAIEAYQQALDLYPNAYAAHAGLARTYQQAGDLETAMREAEIALELAPKDERQSLKALLAELEGRPGK